MAEPADRSLQNQAGQAAKGASGTASGYGATAGQIGSQLIPTLQGDVNNPTGYSPEQTNKMLVGGEQGAGGANAGIAGKAGLTAARTRNTGALSGVLDQAARSRGQTLSQNALGVENKSADLAQKKRSSALGELGGLYGTDVSAQLKAMGLIPEDIKAGTTAGDSGWYQNLLAGLQTGSKVAGAAAGV